LELQTPEELPEHIRATVAAIATLHVEHRRGRTGVQRVTEAIAARVATPAFLAAVLLAAVGWTTLNLSLAAAGFEPLDPPPFFWLQGVAGFSALLTTITILIKQRREDELTELRQNLILELAILSEQKSAKVLERIEALRRDMPNVGNDLDPEADALAKPANPELVAAALRDEPRVAPPEPPDLSGT